MVHHSMVCFRLNYVVGLCLSRDDAAVHAFKFSLAYIGRLLVF